MRSDAKTGVWGATDVLAHAASIDTAITSPARTPRRCITFSENFAFDLGGERPHGNPLTRYPPLLQRSDADHAIFVSGNSIGTRRR